jgi:hypothetical protein
MNIQLIKRLLLAFDFEQVYSLLSSKTEDEIEACLLSLAFDDDCLLVYTYLNSRLIVEESSKLHYLASVVMSFALNHLKYGYEVSFYHAKRALELDLTDVKLKIYMLIFYSIPEKLLSHDEAIILAREIYDVDKNNLAAQMVLGLSKI